MPYNYKDFGEDKGRSQRQYAAHEASQSAPASSSSNQEMERAARPPQHFVFGPSSSVVPYSSIPGYRYPTAEQTFAYQSAWQASHSGPYAYSQPTYYLPPARDVAQPWQAQWSGGFPSAYHSGEAISSVADESVFCPPSASIPAVQVQDTFELQQMSLPRRGSQRSSDTGNDTEDFTSQESLSAVEGVPTKRKRPRQRVKTGKRFTWSSDAHRDFVSATFTTGLAHALPQQLARVMSSKEHHVSAEAASGYLLKYREKQEERRFLGQGTYPTVASRQVQQVSDSAAVAGAERGAKPLAPPAYVVLTLPQLTPEEASSQLGSSIGFLLGLLRSLEHQVMLQRVATPLPTKPIDGTDAPQRSPRPPSSSVLPRRAAGSPPAPALQEAQAQLLRLRALVQREATAKDAAANEDDDPSPAKSSASGPAASDARTLSLEETLELSSLEDALDDDDKLFSFLNAL